MAFDVFISYLLNRLDYYLWQRGEYEQVESLHQRALAINESALGLEDSRTATSLVYSMRNRGGMMKQNLFTNVL